MSADIENMPAEVVSSALKQLDDRFPLVIGGTKPEDLFIVLNSLAVLVLELYRRQDEDRPRIILPS